MASCCWLTQPVRHLDTSAGQGWRYAAAWLPFLTIYLVAFIANDVPVQLAVRNALATILPDALPDLAAAQGK